ncbi:Zn-ribbon domain-containing OB-fold protein [Ramlibacter sp. GTP1]|uniref:Zn-ribbon domain-containing OB-fold protein n=1 Tax=Ramlibacter albus TaxID=2079448 RepID=A0A923M2Z9_9BURK|nr:Zn-ribbon domain-containing OB-fold protein [Ramlibacter albus]
MDPREAHDKPLPTPDSDSRAYWEGLKDGRLLLQHCNTCGHVQFYQQALCRKCLGTDLAHRAASGRGTVHSFSVVHRAPGPAFKQDTPYAVLLVELAEGPRMISSLIDADPMSVAFDMPVELVCDSSNADVVLPRFRPVKLAQPHTSLDVQGS